MILYSERYDLYQPHQQHCMRPVQRILNETHGPPCFATESANGRLYDLYQVYKRALLIRRPVIDIYDCDHKYPFYRSVILCCNTKKVYEKNDPGTGHGSWLIRLLG
jgi:hypothetical protein